MKRKFFWLCALRESVKCCIILAGLFIICLPEAWAEGGTPLLLVVLAMVGCGALIFVFRALNPAMAEGCSFAILLMNVAAPLIERVTRPKSFGEVKSRA